MEERIIKDINNLLAQLFQKIHEAGYEWDFKVKKLNKIDDEWVDLGLPSGTLWRSTNEEEFYTYDEAVENFGDQLPTKEQLEELKEKCTWVWQDNGGYKVIGQNGNFIILPASGYRFCNGGVSYVGTYGHYWLSAPSGSGYACNFYFYSSGVRMCRDYRCSGQSVRLVKNK